MSTPRKLKSHTLPLKSPPTTVKSQTMPLKAIAWAQAALPRYRRKRDLSNLQLDMVNGKMSNPNLDISLLQAARDGLIDILLAHLRRGFSCIYDTDEDGFTAMHHAARYNRSKVLQILIEANTDVNVRSAQDESTPLHMACRYNSGAVTQLLLIQGAEVNVKDIKGKTPLHYATRRGNDVAAKMLLSVSRCDANAQDSDFTTPLIMAAIQGNECMCELLLSRGANLAQKDINDMTALMWGAGEGHAEVTELLLKSALRRGKSFEGECISACDNEGSCALMLAVQNGSLQVCQLLLNHGADVDLQKNNLSTPLHLAASNGYLDIAELLIFRGADVEMKDAEQMTPIHKAALYNKKHLIELLISHGADVNATDKKNMSPLHCASWKGQTDAVTCLLENGSQLAEADSSLKTALHWTVQFGHYDTLISILKNGGASLINATDKNDQTVLHYAAYIGNVSVLKTLLEYGANPATKDQEERTPLHIAAEYDNVSCVEILIESSNHQTNDDDVDGRTPLLTACLHGHYHVVQILLSLAADISKTDDEHCTALMLAAMKGHTTVMKLLLDNQSRVNDLDKMKNSALHYSCAGGHCEAVQLLLDKRVDGTLKNTHDHTALDLAIDNLHSEVTMVMLRHRSWKDMMNVRDSKGLTPMDRLIEKLPDAAQLILDHCVERSSRDDDEVTLTMVFDYQYIDPGPDDPGYSNKRYFALNTMVLHHRDMMLSHPLCQSILSQKWVRFGRSTFYFNLLLYIGYLFSLTAYELLVDDTIRTYNIDEHGCENLTTHSQNGSLEDRPPEKRSDTTLVLSYVLFIFVVIFLFREFGKLVHQRVYYLFNFFNLIPWVMMISTIVLLLPINNTPCVWQWRGAWIALFLGWINFIMYLRRIHFVGIYVIMFVTVLISLLKAIFMFFFFTCAFAGSFHIVLSTKKVFDNLWTSMVNIVVMTLGEIEYIDNMMSEGKNEPFHYDLNILLILFLFVMPIVLMNLMIGIAVGDIEKIQHNAYLKRIALQVDLLYLLENNMPMFLQRRAYVRRATIKPNEEKPSRWQKAWRSVFGSSRNVQFIPAERKDKMTGTLEKLQTQLATQQQRMRSMQMCMQQQMTLLQQIGTQLNVTDVSIPIADLLSPYPRSEQGSLYDNMTSDVSLQPAGLFSETALSRQRQKSIRISSERPRSVHI